MKIETKPRDDHQVSMIVEVEAERMEGAKRRAARRISERKSIPGFRPGKAPYDVVLRSFGEGVITEEAVDLLLDEIYPEALKEAKIDPSGPGNVENIENMAAPKFTFVVPLKPVVDLGEYRAVRLPYDWQAPGDDQVDVEIEELRRMYSKTEAVNRPVESGDFVLIDLKGVKTDSAAEEAPLIDRPGYPVFVRPNEKADEWPYNGFSRELLGLLPGESKSFTHEFEKDHKDEDLQGKTVKLDIQVKTVRGAILPELNDEFAKTVGSFANLQALKDAVRANLTMQSKTEYDNDFLTKVIEKIKEGATIKYPPQMIEHEIEHVTEDLTGRLAQQGLDMDAYLKSRQMDKEKFIAEEARPAAIRRLDRSLILDEVSRLEKIEVSDEKINAAFQQTWGEIQGNPGFQKTMRGKSQPPKRLMNAIAMESAGRALTQQTLERLKEIALGQAPELPAEENAGEKPAEPKKVRKQSTGPKKTTGSKKVSAPVQKKTSSSKKKTIPADSKE